MQWYRSGGIGSPEMQLFAGRTISAADGISQVLRGDLDLGREGGVIAYGRAHCPVGTRAWSSANQFWTTVDLRSVGFESSETTNTCVGCLQDE